MSLKIFEIKDKLDNKGIGAKNKARTGCLHTVHGDIETPAFITVATKATVKGLKIDDLKRLEVPAILGNTYHLYLSPGTDIINKAGGFANFMNWKGPTMTDSGGFQAFSLGVAYGKGINKVKKISEIDSPIDEDVEEILPLANITEEGVNFRSIIDGSKHIFTPEKSMEIQHVLGADIFFAFDECTSPLSDYEYQKEALERTTRWAKRSIEYHDKNNKKQQTLFGVIQGGRFADLRRKSANDIANLGFPGFGIGGSFDKEDISKILSEVIQELPEESPKHLLGIGEPLDIWLGVERGIDTFDCVLPTRLGRNGGIYTRSGRININNAKYKNDFTPIESDCDCFTCLNHSRAYIHHLFKNKEMLAGVLSTIHNIRFMLNLMKEIRFSISNGTFENKKEDFIQKYYHKN